MGVKLFGSDPVNVGSDLFVVFCQILTDCRVPVFDIQITRTSNLVDLCKITGLLDGVLLRDTFKTILSEGVDSQGLRQNLLEIFWFLPTRRHFDVLV